MIEHELSSNCACAGTGVRRLQGKREARATITPCGCPAGRMIARESAAMGVVMAVGAIGKAFR